jgi:hypothetical protein
MLWVESHTGTAYSVDSNRRLARIVLNDRTSGLAMTGSKKAVVGERCRQRESQPYSKKFLMRQDKNNEMH